MKRHAPPRSRARGVPKRHRRYRNSVAAKFCPGDAHGPRIPALLREFAMQCGVDCHHRWLLLLQTSCEAQGCLVRNCRTGVNFAQTHGAKSLIHSVTMFLTYYVPRKVCLRSDHEWRQLLAALYTFHNYCARKRYIKDDHVLTTALYTLRNFRICTIPRRITELAIARYWTQLEQPPEPPLEQPAPAPAPAPAPVPTPDQPTTPSPPRDAQRAPTRDEFAAVTAAAYEEAHAVQLHAQQAQPTHAFARPAAADRTAHVVADPQQCLDEQSVRRDAAQHARAEPRAREALGEALHAQRRGERHATPARQEEHARAASVPRQEAEADDAQRPSAERTEEEDPFLEGAPALGGELAADESTRHGGERKTDWNGADDEDDDDELDCYEAFLGGDMPLIVAQVMDDGWLLRSEDFDVDAEYTNAFLHLPPDVAKMGMRGMSLSCIQIALRHGIWRPIRRDDIYIANAYPPDEIFYY